MELKKCPFCGNESDTFLIPANTVEEIAKHPKWRWEYPGMWIVGCDTPGCFGNRNNIAMCFLDRQVAINAWNRRADDEQPNEAADQS